MQTRLATIFLAIALALSSMPLVHGSASGTAHATHTQQDEQDTTKAIPGATAICCAVSNLPVANAIRPMPSIMPVVLKQHAGVEHPGWSPGLDPRPPCL